MGKTQKFWDDCWHPDACPDDAAIPINPWPSTILKMTDALLFIARPGGRVFSSVTHLVLMI